MSAHTPGPWTQGEMGQVDAEFVYAGGIPIADFGLFDDLPEAVANARLAAAAPELLACLIETHDLLECVGYDRRRHQPLIDKARAAVAKAMEAP